MKDLNGSFIFAVCLLAFTALVFFFKYGSERVQTNVLKAEVRASETTAMNLEREMSRHAEVGARAEEEARKNIEKANQAKKMLERARAESAMSKKELLDSLNAQLEREAEARLSAEKALAELAKQRDILRKTVENTRKSLEDLRAQKQAQSSEEIRKMKKLLKEKEAEIVRLKSRQSELEELRARAAEIQKMTEEEILERGGQVLLPRNKRILSPNIRSH